LGLRMTAEPPEEWSGSVEIAPSDVIEFAGLALSESEECKFMARLTSLVSHACQSLFLESAASSRSKLRQVAVLLRCRALGADEAGATEPGCLMHAQNAHPTGFRSEHCMPAATDMGIDVASVARHDGCLESVSAKSQCGPSLPHAASMQGPLVEPNLGVRSATTKCSQAGKRCSGWRRWKSGVLRLETDTRTTATVEPAEARWKSTGSSALGAVETVIETEAAADALAEDAVIAETVRALFSHRDDGPGAMKRMQALLTDCRDPSCFHRYTRALQMLVVRREFDVCWCLLNSLRRTVARASEDNRVDHSEEASLSRQFNATLDRLEKTIAAATGSNPRISACSSIATTHTCGM